MSMTPRISVIIPAHNAAGALAQALQSILVSRFDGFEVLVVDDASTDETVRVASSFSGCRVVSLPERSGPGKARNEGVRQSSGECVVFMDADVTVSPDALERLWQGLQKHDAVFGIYGKEAMHRNLSTLVYHAYSRRSAEATRDNTGMFYSYFAGIRRKVFEQAGGFDESWKRATFEDVAFGQRLKKAGADLFFDRDLEVEHHVYYRFFSLLRAYFFKSRDLARVALAEKKMSLGEGWAVRGNFLILFALLVALASFGISPWVKPMLGVALLSSAIFLWANRGLYGYVWARKPLALPGALLLSVLANLVAFLGGAWAWLERLGGRHP